MKFSPLPCYLVIFPPHPILKHTQPKFFPRCNIPPYPKIYLNNSIAVSLIHISPKLRVQGYILIQSVESWIPILQSWIVIQSMLGSIRTKQVLYNGTPP
jgi:hypothetical protein